MTNENISVQNDVETIEIATTDIDVKKKSSIPKSRRA